MPGKIRNTTPCCNTGPNILTWEDYAVTGFPSYTWEQFYGTRGWAMSANGLLNDPALLFYDPMESAAATGVISSPTSFIVADPPVSYVFGDLGAVQPGFKAGKAAAG